MIFEFLFFGLLKIASYAVLLGIVAMPIYVVWRISLKLGATGAYLRWLLPLAGLGAAVMWGKWSYDLLESQCLTVQPLRTLSTPQSKVTGIALVGHISRFTGLGFSYHALLDKGVVKFVDDGRIRHCQDLRKRNLIIFSDAASWLDKIQVPFMREDLCEANSS